ncbi:MAG: Na/Pi cotransporter family protein [Actinobacteria bacterium]|nr:Na/Pi cotransporter family protein [Actinomycetota bacterium]MBU1944229.1 Na/Pi cotransporter family protein [Actinomycetota bacterium]MBU2688378.1 Na/Pi cotransporter family protein [Actinomycetota bacterium]
MWTLVRILGGLAVFIFGMSLMSEGFQTLAGGRFQRVLETLTSNRWLGALVGAGVTSIIQSSSVTTTMLVGFVNAGLMTFTASVAVTMGSAVGTTVTAQIVAFDIGNWAFLLITIGFSLYFFSSGRKYKFIGEGLLGLGFIFLGLALMKTAVSPLKDMAWFKSLLDAAIRNPLLGLLIGVVLTGIVQSSSATTGMMVAMAMSGVIPGGADGLRVAIPFVMGANIGTTVTALLASIGTSRPARRTAVANVMFKALGMLVILPFLPLFYRFITWAFGSMTLARQIAMSHTCMSIIIVMIGLPLLDPFIKLVKLVVRGDDPPAHRDPLAIDPVTLHSSWTSLIAATKETAYMGRIASEMIGQSLDLVKKMNRAIKQDLLQKERIVDNLAESITVYLSKVSREVLDERESRKLISLMHSVNDIERAADHAENIMYLAQNKSESKLEFPETSKEELSQLSSAVEEMFSGIIEALEEEDPGKAERYQYQEHSVDEMAGRFRGNNIIRLNNELISPQTGVVFIDILTNLERIGDLANNIGYGVRGDLSKL